MGYSYLVTQRSTNPAQKGLTLLSGQNMFLTLWYSNSMLNAYVKFLRLEKVSKREKKSVILHGWESREQKHSRNMKMRTITCFGDRTSGTFLIIASVSRKKRKRIKKRKKSLILLGWESREKKNRGIWKWEQLLTLVIGQAVLSL